MWKVGLVLYTLANIFCPIYSGVKENKIFDLNHPEKEPEPFLSTNEDDVEFIFGRSGKTDKVERRHVQIYGDVIAKVTDDKIVEEKRFKLETQFGFY